MIATGGSPADKRARKRGFNLTGAGNAIILPGRERVEGVRDGMLFNRKVTGFLMRYNYRRREEASFY